MHVGILSDTHNRHDTVERALAILRERGVTTVLHCGDIADSETVWLFHGFTVSFVFGNCDFERVALAHAIDGIGGTLYRPFGEVEWDGVRIGFIRLPEICSNVCFGGPRRNRLFMTASQSLYALYVETRGAHIA